MLIADRVDDEIYLYADFVKYNILEYIDSISLNKVSSSVYKRQQMLIMFIVY